MKTTKITVPIDQVDPEYLSQLEYALTFADEALLSYRLNLAESRIEADVASAEGSTRVAEKIRELVHRYEAREPTVGRNILFEQRGETRVDDAWQGLLDRRWVSSVGEGHVVLRGPAALLRGMIDARIERIFASEFGAEREYYPSTILCRTLDRINHFTSFPEHVDFVAHLRRDLDVINGFSEDCRESGWHPDHHGGRMGENDMAITPSCCYHCYEGMEGWALEPPGRTVTAIVECHRYEGGNHRSLSRLRAFTQREIIWVGHPQFVMDSRARAEKLIVQWARDWELTARFETANDLFFTDDYGVKATFQLQREAKRELRLLLPAEDQWISVFSSNFHSNAFGSAFDITVNGRPATSGCLGWGHERWVYAIVSQFGFEPSEWPEAIRTEFEIFSRSAGVPS